MTNMVDSNRIDNSSRVSPLKFHWWELVARIAGSLVLSILVPLITGVFVKNEIKAIDQFFLGVLVFFSVSLVGMVLDVSRLRIEQERERRFRFIENEFRSRLYNIEKAYQKILRSQRVNPDLYSRYFDRVVSEVEQDIKRAAEQGELEADEKHVETTDILYSCLQGRDEDVLRLVHFFKDNDFMYSTLQPTYYRRLIEMVDSGDVVEVRRLFIYKNDEKEQPSSQKLLEFHQRQPGYRCQLIEYKDFKNFCDDQAINKDYADFGIYGQWYVYKTESAEPQGEIKGVYHSSKKTVDEYIQLFDTCWKHGDTPDTTPDDTNPMSLDELFGNTPKDRLTEDVPRNESVNEPLEGD